MEIDNYSQDAGKVKRNNHYLLPRSIRGLIIGKSGCGKTNMLLNLLLKPGWLDYSRLYVFGQSFHQPEYKKLRVLLKNKVPKEAISQIFLNEKKLKDIPLESLQGESEEIKAEFFEDSESIPDPRKISESFKNLMIFDDVLLGRQNKCEAYYTRGRHSNIDCFYLSQSYFQLPRQTIRGNSNFICFFKQDLKNINHIYQDHVSSDLEREEFRNLCKTAWEKPYGFICIDLTRDARRGKYRIGFDIFYIPKNYLNQIKCRRA